MMLCYSSRRPIFLRLKRLNFPLWLKTLHALPIASQWPVPSFWPLITNELLWIFSKIGRSTSNYLRHSSKNSKTGCLTLSSFKDWSMANFRFMLMRFSFSEQNHRWSDQRALLTDLLSYQSVHAYRQSAPPRFLEHSSMLDINAKPFFCVFYL